MTKNILRLPSFSVLVLYFLIKTADALDESKKNQQGMSQLFQFLSQVKVKVFDKKSTSHSLMMAEFF